MERSNSTMDAPDTPATERMPFFQVALPVWPEGRETEMNLFVEFRTYFHLPTAPAVSLHLTGASFYRAFVNGKFAGYGPARAWHGAFRVDQWDVTPKLKSGRNDLVVEVAGYNLNCSCLPDQPSFLQAELVAGQRVLAATGVTGFTARVRQDRVRKVQRFSFQRPFSEIWQLPGQPSEPARCGTVPVKSLASRRVPYPVFEVRRPIAHIAEGEACKGAPPESPVKERSLTDIDYIVKGFREQELYAIPSIELQAVRTVSKRPAAGQLPFALPANSYRTLDFGVNLCGFIGAKIRASTATRLFLVFDEILTNGEVNLRRNLECVRTVLYELQPGAYEVESFEPYSLRYLKFLVLEGACEVQDCYLRELANPEAGRGQFCTSDPRLNRIFEAARETFRQCAVDLFMDNPSRERAGWLCDSYFTARAAPVLCGNTTVEKMFLENFQRPDKFPNYPEGLLPCLYPGERYNVGTPFIVNYPMWLVLQLEEYLARSGDRGMVDGLRLKTLKLLDFYRKHENPEGLLEKLPHWIFVEHSIAGSFVQDVSYPVNMLYAGALDSAGRLYQFPELAAKAARLRETIRRQSFDGEFFVDNAVRRDGKLQATTNRTETCQYYAFYFGVATPELHPKLWRTLVADFGPRRERTKAFPAVHPAAAFMGHQLRIELLVRGKCVQQTVDDVIEYWLPMADSTGTLWEHITPRAALTQGFQANAAAVFLGHICGLHTVDPVGKIVRLRFADLRLDWCKGSIPTSDGPVELQWEQTGKAITYRLRSPSGYRVSIENLSGKTLTRT